jgi:hypothetical protein
LEDPRVCVYEHYQLLLETPEPNLVVGIKWLQGTYTQRFNRRRDLRGHLFQGRYKALVIDGEESAYFLQVHGKDCHHERQYDIKVRKRMVRHLAGIKD